MWPPGLIAGNICLLGDHLPQLLTVAGNLEPTGIEDQAAFDRDNLRSQALPADCFGLGLRVLVKARAPQGGRIDCPVHAEPLARPGAAQERATVVLEAAHIDLC